MLRTIGSGLRGAGLLAIGRPDGLLRIRLDRTGAAISFWAAGICLPLFYLPRLLDWWATHPTRLIMLHQGGLDLGGYVIGWAGFALACRPLAAAMGREQRWFAFIATWNWCSVMQYALLAAALLPGLLHAPGWVGDAAGYFTFMWAIWIEWFVTRLVFSLPGLPAAGFVALDLAIGTALAGLIGVLMG